MPATETTRAVVDVEALKQLLPSLERRGYQVVGPTLRDGAIIYDTISKWKDIPAGWTDEQEPGRYRLIKQNDSSLFAYTVGPQSWKRFLHPPETKLLQAERNGGGFRILDNDEPSARYAFIGVRACELRAIELQDRVFTQDQFVDPAYTNRRRQAFIVAVNCTRSSPTCFCASMQTGPEVREGFDLALTELTAGDRHLCIVDVGSTAGAEVLKELHPSTAPADLCQMANDAVQRAAAQSRRVDTEGVRELLTQCFDHPRWDAIAARCLRCANCTMVCPTCFCTSVEDSTDITGDHAARWRKWDSCFTQSFSYIHGGSVRTSAKSRYRQWMTHKFSSWVDQFGSLGCVGCGRCITWCPVGIDITEELHAFREGNLISEPSEENDNGIS